MKKTILEWYEHLPEPIRSQAIENYDGTDGLYDTLAGAVWMGAIWHKTPQGHEYWASIHRSARKGEFDTPIESDIVKAARNVVEQRKVAMIVSDNLHYAIDELERLLK